MNKEELLTKVDEYSADSMFVMRLQSLVADHTRILEKQARDAQFAARLLENFNLPEAIRLDMLGRRRELFYGEQDWVPHEYQTLEDHGLVHCAYGSGAADRPRTRTISMTEAGKRILALMEEKKAATPHAA